MNSLTKIQLFLVESESISCQFRIRYIYDKESQEEVITVHRNANAPTIRVFLLLLRSAWWQMYRFTSVAVPYFYLTEENRERGRNTRILQPGNLPRSRKIGGRSALYFDCPIELYFTDEELDLRDAMDEAHFMRPDSASMIFEVISRQETWIDNKNAVDECENWREICRSMSEIRYFRSAEGFYSALTSTVQALTPGRLMFMTNYSVFPYNRNGDKTPEYVVKYLEAIEQREPHIARIYSTQSYLKLAWAIQRVERHLVRRRQKPDAGPWKLPRVLSAGPKFDREAMIELFQPGESWPEEEIERLRGRQIREFPVNFQTIGDTTFLFTAPQGAHYHPSEIKGFCVRSSRIAQDYEGKYHEIAADNNRSIEISSTRQILTERVEELLRRLGVQDQAETVSKLRKLIQDSNNRIESGFHDL